MKKFIQFCLCLTFICFMSCNMSQHENNDIPKSEQTVNNLLNKIAFSLEQKYNMHTIGTAISMPSGIVIELGLDFQIQGPLSRENIRKILIHATQEFLSFVNSDEAIRPYLEYYPFKIKNIEISLFLIDSKGLGLNDPHISIAGIADGMIIYKNLITTDNIPSIKSEFEESYEDALKALQGH